MVVLSTTNPLFPPTLIEAIRLNLWNDISYHGQLSSKETTERLKNDGDFLFQDQPDSPTALLLSVFHEHLREFAINIRETPHGGFFTLGRGSFPSLDALIAHLRNHPLKANKASIPLGVAVCRPSAVIGRFGVPSTVTLAPRYTARSMMPIAVEKIKSTIVPLRKEVVTMGTTEELEELVHISAGHRNLISLLDFAFYPSNPSDIFLLRYSHTEENLFEHIKKTESISKADIFTWIYEASDAASYLAKNDILRGIISAQECYLVGESLRLGGYWKGEWKGSYEEILRHRWLWRFCSPEILLGEEATSTSLIYNLGLFIWQISTSCLLLPFAHHQSVRSLLQCIRSERILLPDSLKISGIDSYPPALHANVEKHHRLLDSCLRLPAPLKDLIMSCTVFSPDERALWPEVLRVTKREKNIATITGVVKKILPMS